MASASSSSTALPTLQKAAKWVLILAKLGAVACILTLMICGTRLLRGSHAGRDDLLGKSLSMVSFSGIAAKAAGAAPPYLAEMHWFLVSFAWEWLETSTDTEAAGYVFVQPARPLQMPAVLHDVAASLRSTGHIITPCQSSAAETCIGLSNAFFDTFDSASPLKLHNGPAFVFYVLALTFDVVVLPVFSCLSFMRAGGAENRWQWLKAGFVSLPTAFHLISASLLTSNAISLVSFLGQFPEIQTGAAVGRSFLIIAWCGVITELTASTVSVGCMLWIQRASVDDSLALETSRDIPSKSRVQADGV